MHATIGARCVARESGPPNFLVTAYMLDHRVSHREDRGEKYYNDKKYKWILYIISARVRLTNDPIYPDECLQCLQVTTPRYLVREFSRNITACQRYKSPTRRGESVESCIIMNKNRTWHSNVRLTQPEYGQQCQQTDLERGTRSNRVLQSEIRKETEGERKKGLLRSIHRERLKAYIIDSKTRVTIDKTNGKRSAMSIRDTIVSKPLKQDQVPQD